MKQTTYKKRAAIHGLSMAVFLGAALGLQANDHEKKLSVDASVNADRAAAASVDHNFDGKLSRGDANFVREASKGGLMEVKMGQMAADRASNADVKRFGEMLVKDHKKANDKLAMLASQKGMNLAKDMENKFGDKMKDLDGKTGADFDKNFMQHAVKHHRNDVSKFEKATKDLKDTELRLFATETLPTLRAHLDEAQRIARSMGVDVAISDASEYGHDAHISANANAGAPGVAVEARDRDADARVDADVDIDTDKGDGKVLGVETRPGDGKTLGLNTSKTDGKILGAVPAPGRNDAEARVDVDVDHDLDKNRVDVDVDRDLDNKNRVDVDIDRDTNAKIETDVDIDTDKADGKTLGVDTTAGDDKTLGVETRKGDGKVLGIQTGPGDGKTLGVNTRKDDGKLLGIIPAPGRDKAEADVDVDVDRDGNRLEVKTEADVDRDRAIGGPADSEKGVKAEVKVDTDNDRDYKTLNYTELPAKVRATIKDRAGSQNIKTAKRHMMHGKPAYKVEIQKDGRNTILHVAEDGTIIKDNNK